MFSNLHRFKNLVLGIPGVQRYLNNTSWLFSGHIFRLAVTLIVSVALARYLGPEQFGVFNYVLSVVALVGVPASMGLQNYVRPKMVEKPESGNAILGTYFVITYVASLACYILMMLLVILSTERSILVVLFAVIGGTLLLLPFKCFEIWFQAQVAARFPVMATCVTLLIFAVVKLVAISLKSSLITFASILVFELLFLSATQLYLYRRHYTKLKYLYVDGRLLREYLSKAWPLMLSGLAIVVYMRIDQVMIGAILGDTSVGQYAVATRISSIGHFIPQILAASLFPAIINAKASDAAQYQQRLKQFFYVNGALAYAVAIPTSLGAPWIIQWLFGSEYSDAVWVLVVHVWSGLFVYLGVSRAQYLLAEGFLKFSFLCTSIGATTNVLFNAVLIPSAGIVGAAVSTVLSYAIAAFVTSYLYAPVRRIGQIQLKALLIPFQLHKLRIHLD